MQHILLTWNPGRGNDEQWTPEDWALDMLERTAEGKAYKGRWSVGNRVQGIEPGDRAYLLRQGLHGRGLVAAGTITTEPFADKSWREDGNTAQYVNVLWQDALPLEDRIDIDELVAAVPTFNWSSVYSSGRDVTPHGSQLDELWANRAAAAAPLPKVVQGAGFGSADQNRKVEKAAIDFVTSAYETELYDVDSVEDDKCGWDLTATRGEEELHVEVKGVAGSLVRFFLTANELAVGQRDPSWLLVVVTDALSDEPGWCELDGAQAAAFASPALYQVRVPPNDMV